MMQVNDMDLFEAVCRGDNEALSVVYNRNFKMVEWFVVRNGGTKQQAKDVYHDAIIVFWKAATTGALTLTGKISTYLYGVSRNLWLKELKRYSRHSDEIVELVYALNDEFDRNRILQCYIDKLSQSSKAILHASVFEGLSGEEIAIKTGYKDAGTVKVKKYQAIKHLSEMMKSKYVKTDFL